MIFLGCSGWSYPDWVGPFYPSGKTDKLTFYSGAFNSVEINTTFYRVPKLDTFSSWMRRVPRDRFRFSMKFPREVTHNLLMSDVDLAVSISSEFEDNYIIPMLKERMLAAVLIQLPPYFTDRNTRRLTTLLEALSTDRIKYFAEPRHPSLYGNRTFSSAIEAAGGLIAEIDGPESEFRSSASTSGSLYLRFHGRNYGIWSTKTDNPSERYDYEYTGKELSAFAGILKKELPRYDDAYIYFNNHPAGKAPRNARRLSGLLGLGGNDPQARLM